MKSRVSKPGITGGELSVAKDTKAEKRLLTFMSSELFAVKSMIEQKYTVEYDIPNKTALIKDMELSDLDLVFSTAIKEIERLEKELEESEGRYLDTLNELLDAHKDG